MKILDHVRSTITQDGAVLMDIRGGQMLTLNLTGSMIWQHLADGQSPEQIAETLSPRFGISREQALEDIHEFLGQLEAQRLIDPSETANPRSNVGPKPTGLSCNLFGEHSSPAAQNRSPK